MFPNWKVVALGILAGSEEHKKVIIGHKKMNGLCLCFWFSWPLPYFLLVHVYFPCALLLPDCTPAPSRFLLLHARLLALQIPAQKSLCSRNQPGLSTCSEISSPSSFWSFILAEICTCWSALCLWSLCGCPHLPQCSLIYTGNDSVSCTGKGALHTPRWVLSVYVFTGLCNDLTCARRRVWLWIQWKHQGRAVFPPTGGNTRVPARVFTDPGDQLLGFNSV